MKWILILFFIVLTPIFPYPVSAQQFGCVQESIDSPCVLDTTGYGCPDDDDTFQYAVNYCANLEGSLCYPQSGFIACPALTPTPTIPSGSPTATPPTPTPEICSHAKCSDPDYIYCPVSDVCCPTEFDCPPPDPATLPDCSSNGQCQVDWDGQGFEDGGAAGIFDRYKGCTTMTCTVAGVPDSTAAKCKLDQRANLCGTDGVILWCDNHTGDVRTAIGCIMASQPKELLNQLIAFSIQVSGGFTLLSLAYGGFVFITSFGDKNRLAYGRALILNSFIYLVFIVIAALLVNFIGVNVLHLSLFGLSNV
jgi:hypothetical protein